MKNANKYIMISPSIPEDVNKLLDNITYYTSYLPIKKIIIIGSEGVNDRLKLFDKIDFPIEFINENKFINLDDIRGIIYSITRSDVASKRAGWYAQQFIKMKYSEICEDEYYLLWDSDTIPLKCVRMFVDDKPCFDLKGEYHKPYFDTMERLIPGSTKRIDRSFISEHMLICTQYMKELIDRIEKNTDIEGECFQEKILRAIDRDEIAFSGFSEFETYGSFIMQNYQDKYVLRDWRSLRYGGFFFETPESLDRESIIWLSNKYDAISFEKRQKITKIARLVDSKSFIKVFKPGILDVLALCIRAKYKIKRIITSSKDGR